MSAFYGKYRGVVKDNQDRSKLGRLEVQVPSVLGDRTAWAMPCVPYAGDKVGFFALPPKGASVWIEFEAGNTDYPIWSGCFWETSDQLPVQPPDPEKKVLRTSGITLLLDDTSKKGGVTLEIGEPASTMPIKLVADSKGVTLTVRGSKVQVTDSRIELTRESSSVVLQSSGVQIKHQSAEIELGARTVTINNGSLEVD
jgi:uncharacterized protein involved in type VI secretion and phage assembly